MWQSFRQKADKVFVFLRNSQKKSSLRNKSRLKDLRTCKKQFGKPCRTNLPESRKFLIPVRKWSFKNTFYKKIVFLKFIPWTRRKQFSQHFLKIFPECQELFSQTPKKDQKHKEIEKKTFLFIVFLWARKMQICISLPNNFMRFEGKPKVFAQYPKPIKNQKILKISLLLQKVFWTLTMQFWKAFLKTFDWSRKTFRSMSKNEKEFFEKKFSFQMSYRTRRIHFSQPSWKKFVRKLESFRHMIHKLSLNVQNWFKKKFFGQ